MRQANWWNTSFEDLMAELGTWLTEHEAITIIHLDWKHVPKPSEPEGTWYMLLVYK
jgi:hypothetical protein